MTVIRPNSVAGINSITVQSGNSLAVHKSDGSLIRTITANSGVSTFSSISVGTATTDNSAGKSINIGLGASISQHTDNTLTFGTAGDPQITIDASGDLTIPDKIIHSGDTNTAIRFPAADTVTVETGGSERFRVASDGQVRINCTAQPSATVSGYQFDAGGYNSLRISQGGGTSGTDSSAVTVYGGGSNTSIGAAAAMGSALNLINTNSTDNNQNSVDFSNSNSLAIAKVIGKNDSHSSRTGSLIFSTSSGSAPAERARITSAGLVGIGINNPSNTLSVVGSDAPPVYIGGANPGIKFEDTNASGTPLSYIYASDGQLSIRADDGNETASSLIEFKVSAINSFFL